MKNQRTGLISAFFILTFSSIPAFSQNIPYFPQSYPQAIPQNFPVYQSYPSNFPTQQRGGSMMPSNSTQIPARQIDKELLTQEEALEDSLRVQRDKDLAEETEKERKEKKIRETLRKRIFGYSLFNTTKFSTQPNLNIATPNNYVLGPNDQLNIEIYGYSQSSFNPTVTPDGYIKIDRVGIVYVNGMTIEQAREKVISKLSQIYVGLKSYNGYPPNTFATISLGSPRSIKVTILGEVMLPGTHTLSSLSTVLNALYLSGGPNEIGSFRNIQVIRQNKVVATLDLYDLLLNGMAKNNIILQDQDHIKINPYKMRVEVEGKVKRTGIYEPLAGESLDRVLHYTGGFTPDAYTYRLKVTRSTGRERKIVDISSDKFKEFMVENGDSVYVEPILKRFENSVKIAGAVFRPGQYSLDDNPTLTQVIKAAESLKSDAFTGRISIIRTNEDLSVSNISVDLGSILMGKTTDIALKREDIITVPSVFDLTEVANVRIQGAINFKDAQRTFSYVKNMTIEDLIVRAGGLKESASLTRVEVVRRKRNIDPNDANAVISDVVQFEISGDLKVRETRQPFFLQPYDEIFVRTSPNYYAQTFAKIEGEVLYPDEYGIRTKDEKISDLIKRAGGLSPLAYPEGATLIRVIKLTEQEIAEKKKILLELSETAKERAKIDELSTDRQESIGIDLVKILQMPAGIDDMIVQDGDIIKIPKRLETVKIQGEVLHPSTAKFFPNLTFSDYVARSGGFTAKSLRRKSYVMYPNGNVDKTDNFLFLHIYPKIEPGTEIIIPSKTFTTTQEKAVRMQSFVTAISTTLITIIGINTAIKGL